MDSTVTRDRTRWQTLFDEISLGRNGQLVTIEVLDEEIGDQTEATDMPFDSMGYDERADVLVLAVKGRADREQVVLRHVVHSPREVDVLERPDESLVMRVVDAGGTQTLVVFRP